jgi:general secretion pathway protein B
MSYILDALRKSDQQRQRGATPTLRTAQITAAQPRQFERWIYGLIAAVLVGAGVVIGWLHPWQSEPSTLVGNPTVGTPGAPVAREVMAAKPMESNPRPMTSVPVAPAPASPDTSRTPVQEPPIQKPQDRAAQTASASPGAATAQEKATPSSSSVPTRDTPTQSVTSAPPDALTAVPEKPVNTADSAQEPRVMTMGELPASILQELPTMQISLHLHSTKPANRFVSINNQMLQEGAYPAPGLKLEQITPDGMIFSYKGYRFRRGVQ